MQTIIDHQNSNSDNPGWCLLEEFSLGEFLSRYGPRDEPRAGLLFRGDWALSMRSEMVEKIIRILVEFSKEAMGNIEHGALENPGRIRIFCQEKNMVETGAASRARGPYHKVSPIEPTQMEINSGKKMQGGWGYFVVERSGDVSRNFSKNAPNSIELYLYKEGG